MGRDSFSDAAAKPDETGKTPLFYTMRMNYQSLPGECEPPFWVTQYKLSPIRNSPTHAHEYMQINYVCRGRAIHIIRHQEYTLIRGDFFIIPPYVEHRLGSKPGEDAEVIQFEFLASFIHQSYQSFDQVSSPMDSAYLRPFLVQNNMVRPRLRLSGAAQAEVEAVLREILRENERKKTEYELIIRSMLFKLLVLLGREAAGTCYTSPHCTQRRCVLEAVDYVNANYRNDLTVELISRKFLISTSYFSTLFKEATTKSFVKYLNGIRVTKAQELLKKTDDCISDIARWIGFRCPSSFGRIFRQEVGLSPMDYRKIYRQTG